MHELVANYQITTPMFLGNVEAHANGIRVPSLKGALRFWWRALNWSSIRATARDDGEALSQLHRREADLFGIAAGDNEGGQGAFLIRAKRIAQNHPEKWRPKPGHTYLLGQGLYHFRDGFLRTFQTNGRIEARLLFRPDSDPEKRREVARALFALGIFGGLGSRARKGFGSLAITGLDGIDGFTIPQDRTSYVSAAREILAETGGCSEPPFTAFSSKTSFQVLENGRNDALQLLHEIGFDQQLYRSYGRADRNGKHWVHNTEAEQNFEEDHDQILAVIKREKRPEALPNRAVFGLPHNYFYGGINRKLDINPGNKDRTRRASPLFQHIHTFPDGTAVCGQALIRAHFLPLNEPIVFKRGREDEDRLIGGEPDWATLSGLLDRQARKFTEVRP